MRLRSTESVATDTKSKTPRLVRRDGRRRVSKVRRRGLTKESRFGKEMGAGSIAAEHYRDQSTSSSQLSTTTTQDADHVTVSK